MSLLVLLILSSCLLLKPVDLVNVDPTTTTEGSSGDPATGEQLDNAVGAGEDYPFCGNASDTEPCVPGTHWDCWKYAYLKRMPTHLVELRGEEFTLNLMWYMSN